MPMTTTLIILVHPEAMSFNSQWAAASASACTTRGDTVIWSDLYRLDFLPAEGPTHYPDHDGLFDPLKAQETAARSGGLAPQIRAEIAKINQADRLLFHFPLWWFGPPAMLKGWFDRVLVHGALHDVDRRFDEGVCRGKKALFCVTTGSSKIESGPAGKEGNAQMLLWPLAYALRYCGFDVCKPVFAHNVHGYHTGASQLALEDRLAGILAEQAQLIDRFDTLPTFAFNADSDFEESGQLKADAASVTAFIKHPGGAD